MALYRLLVPIQRCRENVNLFIFAIVLCLLSFVFCVKMYTLSIKIHKEKEEGIAYLCHVGKWMP